MRFRSCSAFVLLVLASAPIPAQHRGGFGGGGFRGGVHTGGGFRGGVGMGGGGMGGGGFHGGAGPGRAGFGPGYRVGGFRGGVVRGGYGAGHWAGRGGYYPYGYGVSAGFGGFGFGYGAYGPRLGYSSLLYNPYPYVSTLSYAGSYYSDSYYSVPPGYSVPAYYSAPNPYSTPNVTIITVPQVETPAPPPIMVNTPQPPSVRTVTPSNSSPQYLIALQDESIRLVAAYWIQDGRLFYITRNQKEPVSVPLSDVDMDMTRTLNRERGLEITLR